LVQFQFMAGNLATLQTAPPFTAENAREMAMRSVESRRAKRKAIVEASAKPSIEPEINRVVRAMKKIPVESEQHDRLSRKLKELWSLAFPTQGAVKSRGSRQQPAQVEPLTPQENLREIKDLSSNQPQS
jgi:hypothetical protein